MKASGSNNYKIEVTVTSPIKMQDSSNFGHMNTSAVKFESCYKILLVYFGKPLFQRHLE